ncbi:MAG: NAD-dependent epimerase/dehydratase family protein [Candidatus Aenigmatarchaeota archaeon]
MAILVTGATGFLGRDLVEALLAKGERVRIITRRGTCDSRIEVVQGDVSDEAVVERAMDGVSAVFHLATNSDHFAPYEEHYKTTVLGTQNIFAAAARHRVEKVVHMSTAAVTTKAKTNYTRAKAEAEAIAKSCWNVLDAPIVRAPLIYDESTLAKLARLSWLPFPYKRQRIHLAYKQSVIEALIGALRYGGSDVYTVADRKPLLLTELYKALASPRPMLWVPPQVIWLGIAAAYPAEAVCRLLRVRPPITPDFIRYAFEDRAFDISKAVSKLKYSPVDTLEVVKQFKSRDKAKGKIG